MDFLANDKKLDYTDQQKMAVDQTEQLPSESFARQQMEERTESPDVQTLKKAVKKYSKILDDEAKKIGADGVKKYLEAYDSGQLQKRYPNLTPRDFVRKLDQLEDQILKEMQVPPNSYFELLTDIPVQLIGSIRDMAQSFNESLQQAGIPIGDIPNIEGGKSLAGRFTRAIGSYLFIYAGLSIGIARAGLQATTKGGALLQELGKGAIADLASTTSDTELLSNIIEDTPLKNPVTKFLKTKPEDTISERKLKAALEGAGLGIVTDSAFKFIKYIRDNAIVKAERNKFRKTAEERLEKIANNLASFEKHIEKVKDILNKSGRAIYRGYKDNISLENLSDYRAAQREEIGRKQAEYAAKMYNAGELGIQAELPERVKTPLTMKQLDDLGKKGDTTADTLLSGEAREKVIQEQVKSEAIRATQIQQEYTNELKKYINEYRESIMLNDRVAIDYYMDEIQMLARLDYAAKDLSAIEGGASQLAYRSKSEAVLVANAIKSLVDKAPHLTKKQIALAHLDMLSYGANPDQLTLYVKSLAKTPLDKVAQYVSATYYGSLLSSSGTIAKNALDAIFNGLVLDPVEKSIAVGIGKVREKLAEYVTAEAEEELAKGIFFNMDNRHHFREVLITYQSLYESALSGLKYCSKAIQGDTQYAQQARRSTSKKEGIRSSISDIFERAEQHRFDRSIRYEGLDPLPNHILKDLEDGNMFETGMYKMLDIHSKLVQIPSKLMAFTDNAVRGAYFDMHVKRDVYRLLANKDEFAGLTPKEILSSTEYTDLIGQAMERQRAPFDPERLLTKEEKAQSRIVSTLQEDAVSFANEQVYQNEVGEFGRLLKHSRSMLNELMPGLPLGNLIVPFLTTNINMLNYHILQRTPVGLLTKRFWNDLTSGTYKADEALAKQAVGLGALVVSGMLAQQDYVTGNSLRSPAEREFRKGLGIQENSVRINDKYYNLDWFGFFGSSFRITANMMEISRYMDDDMSPDDYNDMQGAMLATLLSLGEIMTSKSASRNLIDFYNAIAEQDDNAMERIIGRTSAGLLIPNAVNMIGREFDDTVYEVHSFLDEFRKRIGMGRLPYRDMFGRPKHHNPTVSKFGVPIEYTEFNNDPVYSTLMANGAYIRKPQRKINGVRLTPEEYDELMQHMQDIDAYGVMSKRITLPDFTELSRIPKKAGIEGITTAHRKHMLQKEYHSLVEVARLRLINNPKNADLRRRLDKKRDKEIREPNITSSTSSLLRHFPALNPNT